MAYSSEESAQPGDKALITAGLLRAARIQCLLACDAITEADPRVHSLARAALEKEAGRLAAAEWLITPTGDRDTRNALFEQANELLQGAGSRYTTASVGYRSERAGYSQTRLTADEYRDVCMQGSEAWRLRGDLNALHAAQTSPADVVGSDSYSYARKDYREAIGMANDSRDRATIAAANAQMSALTAIGNYRAGKPARPERYHGQPTVLSLLESGLQLARSFASAYSDDVSSMATTDAVRALVNDLNPFGDGEGDDHAALLIPETILDA